VHHDIAGACSTCNAPQLVPVPLSMQCKGAAAAAADAQEALGAALLSRALQAVAAAVVGEVEG